MQIGPRVDPWQTCLQPNTRRVLLDHITGLLDVGRVLRGAASVGILSCCCCLYVSKLVLGRGFHSGVQWDTLVAVQSYGVSTACFVFTANSTISLMNVDFIPLTHFRLFVVIISQLRLIPALDQILLCFLDSKRSDRSMPLM